MPSQYIKIWKGDFDIVLINSVQFQCSNGVCPVYKSMRDPNWNTMINNQQVYDDLIERIKVLNPKYLLNLCTKGNINMQLILQSKLICSNIFHGTNYTHGGHPSTWYNPNSIIY